MTSTIKPKWTVASVNWDSVEFLEYQAKYFHEFNEDFEYIIYDNENLSGKKELDDLRIKYNKIKVVYTPWHSYGGGAHGIALNQCLGMAKGKYFLAIDPDFFFLKKNILPFLESFFDRGFHAIGTEYYGTTFPMPWGAAYKTKEIKDLNLMSKASHCEGCKKWIYDKDFDTGWQIRTRLQNKPHHAFKQIMSTVPDLGKHSYDWHPQTYAYDEKIIAHHLKGGSFVNPDLPKEELKEIRNKYTEWMWNQLYD